MLCANNISLSHCALKCIGRRAEFFKYFFKPIRSVTMILFLIVEKEYMTSTRATAVYESKNCVKSQSVTVASGSDETDKRSI